MAEQVSRIGVAPRGGGFVAAGLACLVVTWAGGRAQAQVTGAAPTNVVSNVYHSPEGGGDNDRGAAFRGVTDGDTRANGAEGFDTFAPAPETEFGQSDFAGLIYVGAAQQAIRFDTVTFHVGNQFGDGGSFSQTPNLYLLINNVDPNTADPESNPNYVLVSGARLASPAVPNFDEPATPGPAGGNTPPPADQSPITFDLTALADTQRIGYGWAVGGVPGDGPVHFVSVSELSATGAVIPEPGTAGLLGLGSAVLLAARRRRRGLHGRGR